MKIDYIYFTSDDSFDYQGPFGTQTQKDIGLHGFSIDWKNGIPDINSIEGFGAFEDVNEAKNNAESFLAYLEENEKHIKDDNDYTTSYEVFNELEVAIKEMILCKTQ